MSEAIALPQTLRRIYGLIQDKGRWLSRWNTEICNSYKNLNIVDNIKLRRLGWAGRIIRLEDERIPRKFLNGKFHNKIPVGKPRTRGRGPEGYITDPRNTRMEETSRRQ
jgi:hypothetical protein